MHVLFNRLIDYAGLFPPAGLPLEQVVNQYAQQRNGSFAWMLGRLVLPAARLPELGRLLAPHLAAAPSDMPWAISALIGPDVAADLEHITRFNARYRPRAWVDSIEAHVRDLASLVPLLAGSPLMAATYVEAPLASDPTPQLEQLAAAGMRAKFRCGGVTADMIPAATAVVHAIQACTRLGVPFKATAGLHHACSGEYPLTYAEYSPRGRLYGFLNLLLTTAALRAGATASDAIALLTERDPAAFGYAHTELTLHGMRFQRYELVKLRRDSMVAFGSCSFDEPVAELRQLCAIG